MSIITKQHPTIRLNSSGILAYSLMTKKKVMATLVAIPEIRSYPFSHRSPVQEMMMATTMMTIWITSTRMTIIDRLQDGSNPELALRALRVYFFNKYLTI